MFTIDFDKYRVIDLSYTVVPPGSKERPFVINRSFLKDNTYKHEVETHTHVGTHVETPAHFFEEGKDITEFPLTTFMGRAVLLEVDDAKKQQRVDRAYVDRNVGNLTKGDIVICRNNDEENKKGEKRFFPYLTPDAAQWLKEQKIKMLGIDNSFRLGKDVSSIRKLHQILMAADVILIEFLDNLHQLQKSEFYLVALPFKARSIDSSWARVVAMEQR